MNDPTAKGAAKIRDFHKIYDLTEVTPCLPMPFTGPDRAAFWFTHAEDARTAVTEARAAFAEAFGAVFTYRDIWTENGARRQYEALLASGLQIVLTAKTEHVQDEDADAEAGELVSA